MSKRALVNFDLTADDSVDGLSIIHAGGIPLAPSMAHENLRVTNKHDGRFERVLALACAMMEKANPGMVTIMVDNDTDADGHLLACTVTVTQSRDAPRR